ncbi:hypothetical protein [Cytobacillus oceanisediminis]|uniref:hypothetical protein n=1 Tax=Cytobacillus oceanisediminis TaxID=665099 RepID=UPI00119FA0E6|nr:hypothetical protein [Cytobacillus oceanisediminis]
MLKLKSSDDRDWGVSGHSLILIKRLIKRSIKLNRDSTPVPEMIQLTVKTSMNSQLTLEVIH